MNTGIIAYDDWIAETYDDFQSTSYADLLSNDDTNTLYGISQIDGAVYDLDSSSTEAPLSLFRDDVLIEHLGIDMDEVQQGVGTKIIYLNRVFPQIHGTGEIIWKFGTSRTANSQIDWLPDITMSLDDAEELQDYAIDIRISGRYLAYQIRGKTGAVPIFAFTGLDLDVNRVGEQ